jgi:hypothetical protein
MQEFASRHIIPYMEQKVRELNQQISATRKGLKNQFKNFLWRKGKDDNPDATKGSMYAFLNSCSFYDYLDIFISSTDFASTFEGIHIARPNLKLEFWVTTPSCCMIMNLHCQAIG